MTARDFAAWRKRMKYSYTEAAAALGLSRRTIIFYEKGEKPVPGDPAKVTDIVIPRAVALACAALAAGLTAIGDKSK
jgi:predicted transcriptional regulator